MWDVRRSEHANADGASKDNNPTHLEHMPHGPDTRPWKDGDLRVLAKTLLEPRKANQVGEHVTEDF